MEREDKIMKILIVLSLLSVPSQSIQDVIVQVNTVRWSQVVSERFLSISVDPLAIILAGKLGPEAIHMARGLSPVFLRIGGPNTENVKFGSSPSSMNNITVTEEEWVGVNRFAQEAKLDIVLCLRAMRRTQSVWDSANALEIISASHKHGFTDIWQMGWDMSEMTGISGAELGRDIVRLKKILDAFPGYESAPILAPGLTCCMNHFQTKFIKDLLQESATAVSALPLHLNMSGVGLDKICDTIGSTIIQMEDQIWSKDLLLRSSIPRKPIWISETEVGTTGFEEAMSWIVKLGCAAKFGVQVMMKQPHLLSFHTPTHDYWASLLYKNLVGRFVFDSRYMSGNKSTMFVFSQCTRPTDDDTTILDSKWSYEKGGVTIFGVNSMQEGTKVMTRGLSVKEEVVHIYLLTEDKHHTDKRLPSTLFNGQKLTLSPKGELPVLSPKVRKVTRGQGIAIPPNSIFFLVFPEVRVRMCMSNPFATPDEFQDLSKKLTTPHPHLHEESIDSWEDNNAESVYVSFSKRIPQPHKPHSYQEDLKSKLMKDFHKVAGRLGIERDHPEPPRENTKYNFYNDQSWLSKLAEGHGKEEQSWALTNYRDPYEPRKETELSRMEKYALLTSAIYGKDNNSSDLLKIAGETQPRNLNRYVRSAPSLDEKSKDDNPSEASLPSNTMSSDDTSSKDKVESEDKSNTGPVTDVTDKNSSKKLHECVIDYMEKSGHEVDEDGRHSFDAMLDGLKHVNVQVGDISSSEDSKKENENTSKDETNNKHICTSDSRKKRDIDTIDVQEVRGSPVSTVRQRSPQRDTLTRQNLANRFPAVEDDTPDINSFIAQSKKMSSLSGIKQNDFTRIINENLEKGTAFEMVPEPEFDNGGGGVYEEDTQTERQANSLIGVRSVNSMTRDNESVVDYPSTDKDKSVTVHDDIETSTIASTESDLADIPKSENEPVDYSINQQNVEEDVTRDNNEYSPNNSYDGAVLKETPRLRKISEIIEQLKSNARQGSAYKASYLEDRIQKLEGIKSRVADIKEKIKEELNKAREKLALNMESVRMGGGDYGTNDQPAKRNIYEVPDKLAGMLERLNYNYMSNIKPRDRFRRDLPVLSDDDIDSYLEDELRRSANEFYHEQLSHLLEEDYEDESDPDYHYLVPAVHGPRNILMNRQVYPAHIFNLVRGRYATPDSEEEQNLELKDTFVLRNALQRQRLNELELMKERQNFYDENFYNVQEEDLPIRKSREFPFYRNNLRSRIWPGNRAQFEDEHPVFQYPEDLIGNGRYRRSTNEDESNIKNMIDNSISKKVADKNFDRDEIKSKVDEKLKHVHHSLHDLAKEYTKLAEKNNEQLALTANDILSKSDVNTKSLSSAQNDMIKTLDVFVPKTVNEILSEVEVSGEDKEEKVSEEFSEEFTEDWVKGAERVSPPLPTKTSTPKPSSHSSGTAISKLINKIKHLIKFISEFRISDYLKGKRKE